jgi:NTE family protein
MGRVGLVLGAGGTVGQAYHAGVLSALEHDLGWDPRTADVIVGTSAGALSASLLRLGMAASDLGPWITDEPLSHDCASLHGWLRRVRSGLPPAGPDRWRGRWRLPPPGMLAGILRRPWALRPSVVASAMMPPGDIDLTERADALAELIPGSWPEGLQVCATRRNDGTRVVFSAHEGPPARLPDAVAASCAIPGYFTAVTIDGAEYLDGGVFSPSNADVLAHDPPDLVVAISPLSVAGGLATSLDGPLRWVVHLKLKRELAKLADTGTSVVCIEPGDSTLSAMGANLMDVERCESVLREAFLETGAYTALEDIAERLALVTSPLSPRGRAA